MLSLIKKLFGTKNDREVARIRKAIVTLINDHELGFQSLPIESLRAKTAEWKARLSAIEDKAEVLRELDLLLPEAFALVKNACRRLFGTTVIVRGLELKWEMIPFDVQLIGGYALHTNRISEMATGEGKTLVATMPVFLNALSGRGVHVVTVNDYLAQRDSEWMGAVYKSLGLTVGCILNDMPGDLRREQYACDITYGTSSEFGFDYLRDNGIASTAEQQVQRGHFYAIVDEVDSILIDEARTPLIISGPAVVETNHAIYGQLKPAVQRLVAAQRKQCLEFLAKAREGIAKLKSTREAGSSDNEDLKRQIGLNLYRVRLGQPKMPELMQVLEDKSNEVIMHRAELELHGDQTKKELYREKEELYFAIDEKGHDADLTEKGRNHLNPSDPDAYMLPDLLTRYHEIDSQPDVDVHQRMAEKQKFQELYENRAERIHTTSQLLKAYCLYEKDNHYVVMENKVIIVDENTGRLMSGRRWSDGLHQAVEAKEDTEIERETQTYATVTIQNYFRLYTKLAGMTGTAETEANEFFDIYKLGVLVVPTNKPCLRADGYDSVYKSRREKFAAVLKEIQEIHAKGRPILVGTISVETSEQLSKMLDHTRIPHAVLNAKQHQREAEVVARAGQRGAVTIATNMAGRGTDIKLGPGIAELGGLHVLGTERHEARRTDRQLRGRCARQGDPGTSHFFLALEDDLMRLYGSDKMVKWMERLGLEEGQELTHPLLNRSIETAQKRVEQHNFQMRKRTLEYDDVMNKQREILYGFRNGIIHDSNVRDRLMDVMEEVVLHKVDELLSADVEVPAWNYREMADWINLNFPLGISEQELSKMAEGATELPVRDSLYDGLNAAQFAICLRVTEAVRSAYDTKIKFEDADALATVERQTMLSAIDRLWQEHLYNMDGLRNSIGLRAYGQQDPLIEYKKESKEMFDRLMVDVKTQICHNIFRSASSLEAFQKFLGKMQQKLEFQHADPEAAAPADPSSVVSEVAEEVTRATPVRTGPKVGRNDPCPCGSGKKFKQCCGR